MIDNSKQMQTRQGASRKPLGVLVFGAGAVSLLLAVTGLYSYFAIIRLRDEYLANRGRDFATMVDLQLRGPGRRNNLELWRETLETTVRENPASLAFAGLRGADSPLIVQAGLPFPGAEANEGLHILNATELYIVESPIMLPWLNHDGSRKPGALVFGLPTSQAAGIKRLAIWIPIVCGLAIASLLLLTFYSRLNLERFLELQRRQAAELQLATLGRLSATLAHEIRNPLGAIRGLTQVSKEMLDPAHAAHNHLATVVKETERLEVLVSDLLSFARPAHYPTEELDLVWLVRDVLSMLQEQFSTKKLAAKLVAEKSLALRSSEPALRRVLLNILLNAIDASPEGSTVEITLSRAGGKASIEITDEGPGLEGRNPEDLFEPFSTTKAKGSGLGLSISRQIVDQLGGTITISDQVGKGARCSVVLAETKPRGGIEVAE